MFESGDAVLLFAAVVAIGLVGFRRIEGPWLLVLSAGAAAVVVSFVASGVPMTAIYEQVYSRSGYTYGAAKGTGVWIAASGTALLALAGSIQLRALLTGRQPSLRRRREAATPAPDWAPASRRS